MVVRKKKREDGAPASLSVEPIAKRLKQSAEDLEEFSWSKTASAADLDDEIAKLERELQRGETSSDLSSSLSSSDSEDDQQDSSSSTDKERAEKREREREKNAMKKPKKDTKKQESPLILRSLEEERIVPLPKELLPASNCKPGLKRAQKTLTGLRAVVQETIQSYEVADHRPLYCRVCKYQGSSVDDLQMHRASEEHQNKAEIERKATFCRACKKQFTSPAQLQEHLKGKSHKETVQRFLAFKKKDGGGGGGGGEGEMRVCYAFRRGNCGKGESCRFAHVAPEERGETAAVGAVCRYYAQGSCSFADSCKFRHEKA